MEGIRRLGITGIEENGVGDRMNWDDGMLKRPGSVYLVRLLLGLVLMAYIGGQNVWAVQRTETEKTEHTGRLTIAVASDLHLDPENAYAGVTNPLVFYNMEIADALFYDAIGKKADILLLCGDLTNAGGEEQYASLVRKMEAAREAGLKTYVLPGNHDLAEGGEALFSASFKDFGFSQAYSRDTDSLSYSLLEEDLLILMLDTDGYSRSEAYLSESSLQWIEEQLKLAEDRNLQVLAAGHYPLLTEQMTEFVGKEVLLDLFEAYKVSLYLCGHLHQRNVAHANGLTELVVDQAIMYPCSYALLYKAGGTYRYCPQRIDVHAWAEETGQTAPQLLHFSEYEENISLEKSREVVQLLKGEQKLSDRETELAAEFFWQIQQEYFQGTIPAHKAEIYKQPGYKAFMKIAEGTTYGRWIPGFIESAGPFTAGFVLKEHTLAKTK